MLSKRCKICKKSSDIIQLHEGIFDNEMIMVCEECAEEEKIPILKKPRLDKLEDVDRRYTVRERMERMTGMDKRRAALSSDQLTVQHNLNRLRMPPTKMQHEDVVENYYWELRMARRRKKMTLNQVSRATGIPMEALDAIEKGKIPREFPQMFATLEDYFGIQLLKYHRKKINFVMPKVNEDRILNEVRRKMETMEVDEDSEFLELDRREKEKKLKEIDEGDFDFSDSRKVSNITLNDLVELKREKEKKERIARMRKQTEDLLGDDLEIEWDK